MNYGNTSNVGYGYNQGGAGGYSGYSNPSMGGFSNDGNNYNTTHDDSGSSFKKPKNMSLRHVTIKQINGLAIPDDKDAPFIMDGEEISQVIIVAALSAPPESQAASVSLNIEDGTGFLDVRFWTSTTSGEATPLSQQLESIRPRTYVQIVGSLKTFGSKISINGVHVRPITDPNEIHTHFLECVLTHLTLVGTKKSASLGSGYNNFQGIPKPSFVPTAYKHVSEEDMQANLYGNILAYVYNNGHNHELPTSNIQQNFVSQGVSAAGIDSAIEWLVEEGHVYKQGNILKAVSGTL